MNPALRLVVLVGANSFARGAICGAGRMNWRDHAPV
jgi:hypothetical protein